ncbi:hypothetical protein [Chryseobacterium terrae]|uniref:hypothetical protein n=1 Tax=Chryseobacterium terrae TaxID=3163299 RepID=UPI0038B5B5C7
MVNLRIFNSKKIIAESNIDKNKIEAIEKTQIPYYEKLKLFAFENKFKTEKSMNDKIP